MKDDETSRIERPDRRTVRLARGEQEAIGAGLKRMFEDVLNEGVPDDFEQLLDKLEQSETSRSPSPASRRNSK